MRFFFFLVMVSSDAPPVAVLTGLFSSCAALGALDGSAASDTACLQSESTWAGAAVRMSVRVKVPEGEGGRLHQGIYSDASGYHSGTVAAYRGPSMQAIDTPIGLPAQPPAATSQCDRPAPTLAPRQAKLRAPLTSRQSRATQCEVWARRCTFAIFHFSVKAAFLRSDICFHVTGFL